MTRNGSRAWINNYRWIFIRARFRFAVDRFVFYPWNIVYRFSIERFVNTHVSKKDWWDIGILYCGGGSINRDKFSGSEDGSNRRPSCYQGYQQFYDPSRGRQMLLRTSRGNASLRRLIWSGHRGIISNYLALFPTTRHVSDAHCSFFTTATNPMKIH